MDGICVLAQCCGKTGTHSCPLVLSHNSFCRRIMWAQNPERIYFILQPKCLILMVKHTTDWYINLDMSFSAISLPLKDQSVGSRRSPSCSFMYPDKNSWWWESCILSSGGITWRKTQLDLKESVFQVSFS